MRKPPLPLLIAIVLTIFTVILSVIYFFVLKEGAALDLGGNVGYTDVFSSDAVLQYVDDSDIGKYPGKKEFNEAAVNFYDSIRGDDGIEKLGDAYKYFSVIKITDTAKKEALLRSIDTGEEKTYTFDCLSERVFAYKNLNFEFVSSGFSFIDALKPGDTVLTNCSDESCEVLGPDCIIRIEYKGK